MQSKPTSSSSAAVRPLISILALVMVAILTFAGCSGAAKSNAGPFVATDAQVALVPNGTQMTSPVTGSPVTKSNQTPSVVYRNRLYFFCCQMHMRKFCENPLRYINTVKPPNGMDIRGAMPKIENTAAATAPTPGEIRDIAIGSSPVRGPADAPVTIVEFVDIQCPYCIREWPKLGRILTEYPDQVRLIFKHFPLSFHQKARPAHAAMELAMSQAGSEGFWKMHDMIIANPAKIDPADLHEYAKSLNLDVAILDEVLADPNKIDQLLKSDLLEARKHGVRGTPTVFVNGIKMADRSIDAYKARIDEILNRHDTAK
ncbi:MAG: thioredoxin domain-containing protein [Sedimentisphaerales bacterium]|nr:thioredoxin domain-containing protein [Sedimentisphaerales bacterium]